MSICASRSGHLWGFLFGWTLFLVIQTGTIAAVCVAFGKFLGVFFPAVSTTNWLWHIAHVPALRVGPMVLGNMEIGVNTANHRRHCGCRLPRHREHLRGIGLARSYRMCSRRPRRSALAALILLAFTVGVNATAWQANFGAALSQFWRNAGWIRCIRCRWVWADLSVWVNMFVILAVVQVGSLFPPMRGTT